MYLFIRWNKWLPSIAPWLLWCFFVFNNSVTKVLYSQLVYLRQALWKVGMSVVSKKVSIYCLIIYLLIKLFWLFFFLFFNIFTNYSCHCYFETFSFLNIWLKIVFNFTFFVELYKNSSQNMCFCVQFFA